MARTVKNLLIAWCVASYVVALLFYSCYITFAHLVLAPVLMLVGLVMAAPLIEASMMPDLREFILSDVAIFGYTFVLTMVVLAERQSRDPEN